MSNERSSSFRRDRRRLAARPSSKMLQHFVVGPDDDPDLSRSEILRASFDTSHLEAVGDLQARKPSEASTGNVTRTLSPATATCSLCAKRVKSGAAMRSISLSTRNCTGSRR